MSTLFRLTPSFIVFVIIALILCSGASADESAWQDYTNAAINESTKGNLQEAERLYRLALQETKTLGTKNPLYAKSVSNLAYNLKHQGKYREAEPFFQEALATRQKVLGTTNKETIKSMVDLADVYRLMGELDLAEDFFRKALEVREQSLGDDHPDVALNLQFLADIYRDQGKYTDAIQLLKRVISINRKAFGPEHPTIAASLESISRLYKKMGNYKEAARFFEEALIMTENLGTNPAFIAGMLEEYVVLLRKLGRKEEADRLEARAFDLRAQTEHQPPPELMRSQDIRETNSSSDSNLDIFIKESTLLLGKTLEEMNKKFQLQKKERQDNEDQILYKASNTGLSFESNCRELEFMFSKDELINILCYITFDKASKAVDSANNKYPGKGRSVGTGTYFWCINGRGLEIFVDPVMSYVGINDSCLMEDTTN